MTISTQLLTVSPAEIVRGVLIAQGLVRIPMQYNQVIPFNQTPGDQSTLCYVGSMPDDVDQAVAVFDEAGMLFGRMQRGRTIVHPGIQLLIRVPNIGPIANYSTGYNLANNIAVAFDTMPQPMYLVLNGVIHYVNSIYRTSTVISLGEEVNRFRQHYSIHARINFTILEPPLG